jgi:predicted dithiol-disulfide oxidoreductase (DUF899 family)
MTTESTATQLDAIAAARRRLPMENEGFGLNVFLRDGDTVYRTWHTNGRGVEQLSHTFPLIDILPWGRQEEWLDSPEGWPSRPTYSGWLDSPAIARLYGS